MADEKALNAVTLVFNGASRTVRLASLADREALIAYMAEMGDALNAYLADVRYDTKKLDITINGIKKTIQVSSQTDADVVVAAIAAAQKYSTPAFFQFASGEIKGVRFATEAERELMLKWCAQSRETGPTAVKVVSMPDRKTDTTVSRDSNGNIVKTATVERDG